MSFLHIKQISLFNDLQTDIIKALDQLTNDKQIEVQKARKTASDIWLDLQNQYNHLQPDAKAEHQHSIYQIASQYSRLRDLAKETKQKRNLTQDNRDPLEETFKSETKKAIASNYLKKNKG